MNNGMPPNNMQMNNPMTKSGNQNNQNMMGMNPNMMGMNQNMMGMNRNMMGMNPNMMGMNPMMNMGMNRNMMGMNPNMMGMNPMMNMGMNQNMMGMNPNMMGMNPMMNMGMNQNMMGMNPNMMGMNPMMNMNNAIENMNKGLEDTNGWKITFIKDGKEETMKFSKDIIVNEALNKYKIKIGEAGNLKLKFAENKKPVSLSLKICQSGIMDGSKLLVEPEEEEKK